ncbi:hypothetical protein KCP77_05775 [Salmonella enterica subsp. enterica]|nr:hypothetical protein KCP77_05775 [Salmonella enterica subsp. enterica]
MAVTIHEHCERITPTQAVCQNLATKGHRRGDSVSTILAVGPETQGRCSTLQFCDVGGVWPVAIGHPAFINNNEEGIG